MEEPGCTAFRSFLNSSSLNPMALPVSLPICPFWFYLFRNQYYWRPFHLFQDVWPFWEYSWRLHFIAISAMNGSNPEVFPVLSPADSGYRQTKSFPPPPHLESHEEFLNCTAGWFQAWEKFSPHRRPVSTGPVSQMLSVQVLSLAVSSKGSCLPAFLHMALESVHDCRHPKGPCRTWGHSHSFFFFWVPAWSSAWKQVPRIKSLHILQPWICTHLDLRRLSCPSHPVHVLWLLSWALPQEAMAQPYGMTPLLGTVNNPQLPVHLWMTCSAPRLGHLQVFNWLPL